MNKIHSDEGFTGIEIIMMFVVIIILAAIVLIAIAAFMGNHWCGEISVLEAVKEINPMATEVVALEKNFYAYSIATVNDKWGNQYNYLIDASLFGKTTVKPK